MPATAHVLLRTKASNGSDTAKAETINEQLLREGFARVAPVRGHQVHMEQYIAVYGSNLCRTKQPALHALHFCGEVAAPC